VTAGNLDKDRGAEEVETLLANDQPGLFAAIGELGWYAQSHRSWIDDQGLRAGDRVLEVGCATGALTAYLADIGYQVTGLDRSDDMIRRARNDHPGLDLLVGDATSLPHDSGVFDAVVAASVVNVVPDAELVMSEMKRVCVPGGTISVLVPSTDFTDVDFDGLIATLDLTGFSAAALTKWHRSAPKMSPSKVASLFRGAGLEPAKPASYLSGMLVAVTATVPSD
jgi:ubiquinone/menaquinone biosynthesis C-methylase UbiE